MSTPLAGVRLRVSGIVQGVGFRPGTLRLTRRLGVVGEVRNEGTAVVIEAFGRMEVLRRFEGELAAMRRGGARVAAVNRVPIAVERMSAEFRIAAATRPRAWGSRRTLRPVRPAWRRPWTPSRGATATPHGVHGLRRAAVGGPAGAL